MILIIVPAELNLDAIPVEKLVNTSKFVRRGRNRRQDHGTVGNSDRWYYDHVQKKLDARKRRDFRASGRMN